MCRFLSLCVALSFSTHSSVPLLLSSISLYYTCVSDLIPLLDQDLTFFLADSLSLSYKCLCVYASVCVIVCVALYLMVWILSVPVVDGPLYALTSVSLLLVLRFSNHLALLVIPWHNVWRSWTPSVHTHVSCSAVSWVMKCVQEDASHRSVACTHCCTHCCTMSSHSVLLS